MGRKVKCKICSQQIDTDNAYCITKINENTGKRVNSYFCSEQEYLIDKENKNLWLENMRIFDNIIGYTCISKVKTNEFKELEEHYNRKQIYNCLINNADEIKRYLEQKNIYEEYGKIKYIFSCVKNKIKDNSNNISFTATQIETEDIIFETDEQIINRIDKEKERKSKGNIFDILDKINKNK